jgi:hypothetical protein
MIRRKNVDIEIITTDHDGNTISIDNYENYNLNFKLVPNGENDCTFDFDEIDMDFKLDTDLLNEIGIKDYILNKLLEMDITKDVDELSQLVEIIYNNYIRG